MQLIFIHVAQVQLLVNLFIDSFVKRWGSFVASAVG